MIGSNLSAPPDDGSCRALLDAMKRSDTARLVWDDGGQIRAQYERKLKPQTYGREWLSELLLQKKVVGVPRVKLTKKQNRNIRDTGLVGEDLNYYVRTCAASPDRTLASQDSDYDASTEKCLARELSIVILDAREATQYLSE